MNPLQTAKATTQALQEKILCALWFSRNIMSDKEQGLKFGK